MEPRSRELERAPRQVFGPWQREELCYDDEAPGLDWSRQLAFARQHKVTLGCLGLILISLIWKAEFISHYYYRQDDFFVFDSALKSGLSWGYLTHVDVGHLFPGVYMIAWILARVALYNWLLGSAVVLIMIAGASLAAWRLLVTLLGNRPAIWIPLTLYLFATLPFPTYSWWITALEAVPLQIALFMALNSHARYVWTGRFRHAVASAGWQSFGLFFFEKAVVIPFLLFAVTVGFLTQRRLLAGLRMALTRQWKGWLLYLGLLAGYAAVFWTAFHRSHGQVAAPTGQDVRAFAWRQVFETMVPGFLGGPWHWWHTPNSADAFAAPPHALAWVAFVVTLALIGASIVTRPRAWRAWAILAGWVVLADMLPIIIGRLNLIGYAVLFGLETRYVVDASAVLTIAVALAFWPVAWPSQGEIGRARRRELFAGRWKLVAVATVAIMLIGSFWSVQQFQSLTTPITATTNRTYIANAQAALAAAPAGTVIVSQPVPPSVMTGINGGIFWEADGTSTVLGPLTHRRSQITWTSQPQGTIAGLRAFGSDGRLWPAYVAGASTPPLSSFYSYCLSAKRTRLSLTFQAPAPLFPLHPASRLVLRVVYFANQASAGEVVKVRYGSFSSQFPIQPGGQYGRDVYFAVLGRAPNVTLQAQRAFGVACFAQATVGNIAPDMSGVPVPRSLG